MCIAMKFLFRSAFVIIFFLFQMTIVYAMDFKESYEKILAENSEYKAQLFRVESAKSDVTLARADLLPSLSLSANYGLTQEVNDILSTAGSGISTRESNTFNSTRTVISLQQTLFDISKSSSLQRVKSEYIEAGLELLEIREQLILELVSLYTNYLSLIDRNRVTERELKALEKHQELTLQRHELGLGILTDVYEAQSRFQLVFADSIQMKFQADQTLRQLKVLLGENVNSLSVFNDDYFKADIAKPVFEELDFVITNNTLLAEQRIETAKQVLKFAKAQYYPTLDLVGSSSRLKGDEQNVFSSLGDDRTDNQLMLSLEVPLFAGFGNKARKNSARYDLRAVEEDAASIINQANSEYKINTLNLESNYRRLLIFKDANLASLKALKLRESAYIQGLSSNLDLLDSLRESFNTERLYRDAVYQYINSYFTYVASHREITEADIEFFNQHLCKTPTEC